MSRTRRRPAVAAVLATAVAVAAFAVTLLAPAAAQAGPWRPAQPLSPESPKSLNSERIAVNARGDAVASVIEYRDVGGSLTYVVLMTRRPAGGRWSTPAPVYTATAGVNGIDSSVGIDGNGRALVVWTTSSADGAQVRSRTVPVSGALGPVRDLTPVTAGTYFTQPTVAVARNGRAAALWRSNAGPAGALGSVTGLGIPAPLTTAGGTYYGGDLAIEPSGAATFVWERDTNEPIWRIESCRWPVGAGACGDVTVHAGQVTNQLAEAPDVAVNDAGEAIICFSYRVTGASPTPSSIRYVTRSASGVWSPTSSNAAPGAGPVLNGCDVALRRDGSAVLGYRDGEGNAFVAVRTGGGFDGRRQVSAVGEEYGEIRLATGARDHVAAVYSVGGHTRAVSVLPGSRDPSRVDPVLLVDGTAPTSSASVGVDDQGNFYVVALTGRCQSAACGVYLFRPSAVMYDAAPPSLSRIALPSSARRGQTVRLSAVGVTDRVSAVRTTWRFSDGTTATGATISKRLTHAGRLGITVTLTDAAGWKTVRTATLTVRS